MSNTDALAPHAIPRAAPTFEVGSSASDALRQDELARGLQQATRAYAESLAALCRHVPGQDKVQLLSAVQLQRMLYLEAKSAYEGVDGGGAHACGE